MKTKRSQVFGTLIALLHIVSSHNLASEREKIAFAEKGGRRHV